ncbi:MAG: hypothetical protein IJB97_01780 [Clostridia bacterium]|nr:hypothetical protein [Clostridia bacterium]
MKLFSLIRQKLYKRRLKKAGISFPLYCKVHGVKQADRQGAIVQSKAGDRLQFVHVPLKAYPHNVYVYNVELTRGLGSTQKNLAEKLVYVFGKGFCRDGVIVEVTGGGEYKYYGCNLQIFETMSAMNGAESDIVHLKGN